MQILSNNFKPKIYREKQNSQISFTSGLDFKSKKGFLKKVRSFKRKIYVDSPWTSKQIIKARQAYTKGIITCTAGGIVVERGKNKYVVMFHINPDNKEDFEVIKKVIIKKIGKDKPCQAFLLGSSNDIIGLGIQELFKNFEKFITKELKIPCTKFNGLAHNLEVHIAYDGYEDLWTIFANAKRLLNKEKNFYINALQLSSKEKKSPNREKILMKYLKMCFGKVFICKKDNIQFDAVA